MNGELLPQIRTQVPGPLSRALADRLQRVESRNITCLTPQPPIFWQEARGANVRDVDDNVYIDLTSGFGVAHAGHANTAVAAAIGGQAQRLAHALGDVYPAEIKVQLLERIAAVLPAPLQIGVLANSGAEAVEVALKTAALRTGRTGILAFTGAYHGLTYGALAVTHRAHFRQPFEQQLFSGVQFATFPGLDADRDRVLHEIDSLLAHHPIGCIIAEPIQGRGGIIVPPDWFLPALRDRCDGRGRILILDEIYTGCGRTGRWLACEHWQVVPDMVVIGKGLSGALPISAAFGSAEIMNAWPPSDGEAIHTSTFIGNPIACAAALAQIAEIENKDLLARTRMLGDHIRTRTADWSQRFATVDNIRGLGLLQAIVLRDAATAHHIMSRCLQRGVLLLLEGEPANLLAITPPAVITIEQLDHALDIIAEELARSA